MENRCLPQQHYQRRTGFVRAAGSPSWSLGCTCSDATSHCSERTNRDTLGIQLLSLQHKVKQTNGDPHPFQRKGKKKKRKKRNLHGDERRSEEVEEEQSPPLITMNHSAPVASKTTAAISGNMRGGFITLKPLTGQKKKRKNQPSNLSPPQGDVAPSYRGLFFSAG